MKDAAAYMILHYGKPYIAAAVASLYDQVDKIFIAYTDSPSQSFGTDLTCPDTREELLAEIKPYMDKIEWLDGHWEHEYQHCDTARNMTRDYTWKVRFDSDEVFQPGSVEKFIKQAVNQPYQQWRVPMIHFWRSLGKVCRDGQFPIRLEREAGTGTGWLDSENETLSIIHLGYAMPTKYIEYKKMVSGHRNEWRPDWFKKRWLVNAQQDVHPVVYIPNPLWNAEDYDKTKLPDVLKSHPFYDLDVIDV